MVAAATALHRQRMQNVQIHRMCTAHARRGANRPILVAMVAGLATLTAPAFAGIGDNFEQASMAILGSGEVFLDMDNFLSPSNDDEYLTLRLDPRFVFFPRNRLSASLSLRFRYESNVINGTPDRELMLGATTGLNYYMIRDPAANSGMATAVGLGIGINHFPDPDDASVFQWLIFDPHITFYYFVTERIAPFLSLDPEVLIGVWKRDSSGAPLAFELEDSLELNVSMRIGISVHFPNSTFTLDPADD